MMFSIVKAIKSTHRNRVNRILHIIGIPIYATGMTLLLGYLIGLDTNPINGITLWSIAIGLFLTGHKIERNLRAMTLIILFKYLKSRKATCNKFNTI
jgi:uncharacterized membrane protein YGL010W